MYLFIWPPWVSQLQHAGALVVANSSQWHCGIQFPDLGPLHQDQGTGPPGKSLHSDLVLFCCTEVIFMPSGDTVQFLGLQFCLSTLPNIWTLQTYYLRHLQHCYISFLKFKILIYLELNICSVRLGLPRYLSW